MPISRNTRIFAPSPPILWQISTKPEKNDESNSQQVARLTRSQTSAAMWGHSGCGCPRPAAKLPWSHPGGPRHTPPRTPRTTQPTPRSPRALRAAAPARALHQPPPVRDEVGSTQRVIHAVPVSGAISPLTKEGKKVCTRQFLSSPTSLC